MSCVESKYYKEINKNNENTLKAYAIDGAFTFIIERFNPFEGHSALSIHICPQQAKQLIGQLNEFIKNNP